MKKFLSLVITILFIFSLCSFVVFAHSGRTDSNGGHFDSSTGEYHYHHGYPAHQHPNGVCPYATKSSKSSVSSISSKSSAVSKNNQKDDNSVVALVGVLLFLLFVLLKITIFIKDYLNDKRRKRTEIINSVINRHSDIELTLISIRNDTVKFCDNTVKLKTLASSLPQGISIDSNNELHSSPNDIYTVYVSSSRRTIHKITNCSNACIAVNITEIHNKKRCKKCFASPIKQVDNGYYRDIIADVHSHWYLSYTRDTSDIKNNISNIEHKIECNTSHLARNMELFEKNKEEYSVKHKKLAKHKELHSLMEIADICSIDKANIESELYSLSRRRKAFSLYMTANSKEKEFIIPHTCSKCGKLFNAKYIMPNNQITIPTLTVICPHCKSKEVIKL